MMPTNMPITHCPTPLSPIFPLPCRPIVPATYAINPLNGIVTISKADQDDSKKPGMAIRSQEMILTTLAQPASFAILLTGGGTCLLSVKGLKTRFHSSNTHLVPSIRVPLNAIPDGLRLRGAPKGDLPERGSVVASLLAAAYPMGPTPGYVCLH
jgi:hypothetical protein